MADNTRIFITGLPPSFTDDELRRHFSSRSYVTDAHVIPKRKIGFVGFKSNAAALDAVKYFNRSYIRMSKIAVEIARPVRLYHSGPIFPKLISPRLVLHLRQQRVRSTLMAMSTRLPLSL